MNAAALRALLVLFAVLGALSAPEAERSRVDVARGAAELSTEAATRSLDGRGSDEGPEWQRLAMLGEPVPVSISGSESAGCGPCPPSERSAGPPRPRRAEATIDPERQGAFAPGERPAALAYLRLNGCAQRNGAGT